VAVAPTEAVSLLSISAVEGQPISGNLATFSPPLPNPGASAFAVTIGWGDGSETNGSLVANGNSYWVTGTHTYLDESPPGSPYDLTITIRDTQNPALDAVHRKPLILTFRIIQGAAHQDRLAVGAEDRAVDSSRRGSIWICVNVSKWARNSPSS
jgi:hypothetical protein